MVTDPELSEDFSLHTKIIQLLLLLLQSCLILKTLFVAVLLMTAFRIPPHFSIKGMSETILTAKTFYFCFLKSSLLTFM